MKRDRIQTVVALITAVVCIISCITVPAWAQSTGAKVQGTLFDSSKAVIPSGKLIIKNTATGVSREVYSNEKGFYAAPDLSPGDYEVVASAAGFKTVRVTGVALNVGADLVVNVTMEVGQVSQQVEVGGGAAGDIELASSMVSHVVGGTEIRELPLNGRDWTQLALLQPGVAVMASQDAGLNHIMQRGDGGQMTISGGRPSENTYRLNGVSINDYANTAPGSSLGKNLGVDAIQEFSVLTGTYSSEYGRASGGVINAVTKSGTNGFHGSGYEFLRNSVLDSRNFFDRNPNFPGGGPAPFRRNQFGASVGGPIKKDKTFFFFDYEGLREFLSQPGVATVPTAQARTGQLSTGTVTVSPAIKPYLPIYPLPNDGGPANRDTGLFFFAGSQISHENYYTGKVDHQLSAKDSFNATYYLDDGQLTVPDEFNNKLIPSDSRNQSASAQWSHIFSPQVFYTLRGGFSRAVALQGLNLLINNPVLNNTSLAFIPGHGPGEMQNVGAVNDFSGGIGTFESNAFWFTTYQQYQDLYITKGIHSIKIGMNVERDDSNFNATNQPGGRFIFGSLASFLTATPSRFQALVPGSDTVRGERQSIFGAYVQDDIRWRPNLTLNLGVRYEMLTVPNEVNGKEANLVNFTDAKPTVGFVFNNNTLRNFEPRVGFAWDPFKNGKTSVRGGFSIFDVLPLSYLFANRFPRTPPFYLEGIAPLTPAQSSVFPFGGLSVLGTTASIRTVHIEPNPHRSYKMEWDLNVQRELTKHLTVSVGYAGSHGVHLPTGDEDGDIVLPISTNPYVWSTKTTRANVLNPAYGRIAVTRWNDYSIYDALQSQVTERLAAGLTFQVSYTWAHSIDAGSNTFSNNEYLNTIADPYPFDANFNRARSDFDIRQNLVLNLTWELPYGKQLKGPAQFAFGGWQVGTIFQARTGAPFTPVLASDNAHTLDSQTANSGGQRPNFVGGAGCDNPTNPGVPTSYIKLSCFSYPTAGTLGNLGRNTLNGPGYMDWDFSLFKNFAVPKISEAFKAQFRAEFFNVMNHSNFAMLQPGQYTIFGSGGTLNSGTGQIQATQGTSRQIQFALKLSF